MSNRSSTVVSAVLLLGLCACRSSNSSAQTNSTRGSEATETSRSFAQAFVAFERREGAKQSVEPTGSLIDYESDVTVVPDKELLLAIAGHGGPAEPTGEVRQLQQWLDMVHESLEPVLSRIAAFEQKSLAFYSSERTAGVALQDDPRWRAMAADQLEIVKALKHLSRVYVSVSEFNGRWVNFYAEEIDVMGITDVELMNTALPLVGRLEVALAPDGSSYDSSEVTRVANELIVKLERRLTELEETILSQSPKAELQMEAALLRGTERLPISISPYFIVEGIGRDGKPPRVGIPSQADQKLVQEQYVAIGKVADAANALIALSKDDVQLAALKKSLLAAIDQMVVNLGTGLDKELESLLAETDTALAGVQSDAKAIRNEIAALIASVRAFRDGASTASPIQLTNGAIELVGQLGRSGLPALLTKLATDLKALPSTVSTTAVGLIGRLAELAKNEADQFRQAVANQPALGALANLYASLEEVSRLAQKRSFGALQTGAITRRPFSIDDLKDGLVQLGASPADSGDVLETKYTLTVDPKVTGSGDKPLTYEARGFQEVRKFGFYSTYSAQLLFYDRHGDQSSAFQAAPGVCYNLHYRPESAQGFYDVLAPGIGLSVSSPSFEDGTELAIGAQITLFNDMLQAGYAHNISVDDDAGMFYFGFGLIEVFQAAR